MRVYEKVAQHLPLRRKHTGRIMDDYAFMCIYASKRNALNSADEDGQGSTGRHEGPHLGHHRKQRQVITAGLVSATLWPSSAYHPVTQVRPPGVVMLDTSRLSPGSVAA